MIGDAITHDVVRDFKNLMTDRDHGFLMSPTALDAAVERLQRRLFLAGGGSARLNERAAQVPVRFARFPLEGLGTVAISFRLFQGRISGWLEMDRAPPRKSFGRWPAQSADDSRFRCEHLGVEGIVARSAQHLGPGFHC